MKLLSQRVLLPPHHQNTGNTVNMKREDRDSIEDFLIKVLNEQGEECAQRVFRRHQQDHVITTTTSLKTVILLPCSLSIQQLCNTYNSTIDGPPISTTLFRSVWLNHSLLQNMIIRSTSSDECEICVLHSNSRQQGLSNGMTMDENEDQVDNFLIHRNHYRALRAYYDSTREEARNSLLNDGGKIACISFDFAQAAEVPSLPNQPGPFYFFSPYKIFPFGIVNEATDQQFHMCYGEDQQGKGANQVVSLLYYYLENKFFLNRSSTNTITFWADNCAGQNKNKTVIGFFTWLVQQDNGLENVELCFQIKGHTRNAVDRGFGDVKKLHRRTPVWLPEEFIDVINKSTHKKDISGAIVPGRNIGVNLFDNQDVFKNWEEKLTKLFKPLVGISSYQIFRFERQRPGVCLMKKDPNEDAWTIRTLTRPNIADLSTLSALPDPLPSIGLKAEKIVDFQKNFSAHIPQFRKEELSRKWFYRTPNEEMLQAAKAAKKERQKGKERIAAVADKNKSNADDVSTIDEETADAHSSELFENLQADEGHGKEKRKTTKKLAKSAKRNRTAYNNETAPDSTGPIMPTCNDSVSDSIVGEQKGNPIFDGLIEPRDLVKEY